MRHVIITLLLIGMATAVSMSTDCLGLVLELAVSCICEMIVYKTENGQNLSVFRCDLGHNQMIP